MKTNNEKRKATISMIIPAWNEERTIQITLEYISKLKLPFEYSELILVAGGNDNTLNLCENNKSPNFDKKIIIEQKRGDFKSGALIKGIRKSKGNYVILMDADVFPSPNLVIEIIRFLQKFDVVNCDFLPILKKGFWYDYFMIFKYKWAKDPNNLSSLIGGSTISLRKDVIKEIGLINLFTDKTTAGVDYYMGQVLRNYRKRIGLVSTTKVYMPRPNNIKDFVRDRFRWIKAFFQLYSNKKKTIFINFLLSSLYCIFPPLLIVQIIKDVFSLPKIKYSKIRIILIYFFVEYLLNLLRSIVIIGYLSRSLKPIGHFKGTDRYLK